MKLAFILELTPKVQFEKKSKITMKDIIITGSRDTTTPDPGTSKEKEGT